MAIPSVGSIIRRVALPFLLFSTVFFGLLLLSYYLLLPRLTQVEVAGKQHNTAQLQSYVTDLQAEVNKLEDARSDFVTPLRDGLYGAIKKDKFSTKGFNDLQEQIIDTAEKVIEEKEEAIHFASFEYFPTKQIFHLSGDVSNVGPRSMTLLAQFVDLLKGMEEVESVDLPRFTREHSEEKGYYSPFDFTLHIQ